MRLILYDTGLPIVARCRVASSYFSLRSILMKDSVHTDWEKVTTKNCSHYTDKHLNRRIKCCLALTWAVRYFLTYLLIVSTSNFCLVCLSNIDWSCPPLAPPPLWKIPLICFKPSLIMFLRLITSKFQVSFDPIKRPFLCFTMVSLSPLRCRRLLSVSIIVSNTIVILTYDHYQRQCYDRWRL